MPRLEGSWAILVHCPRSITKILTPSVLKHLSVKLYESGAVLDPTTLNTQQLSDALDGKPLPNIDQ
jgi:hypothetical protein